MIKNFIGTAVVVVLLIMVPVFLHAQEHDEHASKSSERHDGSDEGHQTGEHHSYKNHAAVFVGATSNLTHEKTVFTVGLDYERRFKSKFGAGLAGEVLLGEEAEILAGIPVYYHPGKLKFFVAPMMAFVPEIEEEENPAVINVEEGGEHEGPVFFGFRVGAGYDLHIKKLSISPVIEFDYIGEASALVYGVCIGLGF